MDNSEVVVVGEVEEVTEVVVEADLITMVNGTLMIVEKILIEAEDITETIMVLGIERTTLIVTIISTIIAMVTMDLIMRTGEGLIMATEIMDMVTTITALDQIKEVLTILILSIHTTLLHTIIETLHRVHL